MRSKRRQSLHHIRMYDIRIVPFNRTANLSNDGKMKIQYVKYFSEMEAESKFMKCLWRLMIWSGILFTAQNIYRCGKKEHVLFH